MLIGQPHTNLLRISRLRIHQHHTRPLPSSLFHTSPLRISLRRTILQQARTNLLLTTPLEIDSVLVGSGSS